MDDRDKEDIHRAILMAEELVNSLKTSDSPEALTVLGDSLEECGFRIKKIGKRYLYE